MSGIDEGNLRITPNVARLRSFTYASRLHVEVTHTILERGDGDEKEVIYSKHDPKFFIGKVPIMLKYKKCRLYQKSAKDLIELGECEYDQGGYFIINGIERVLIAQERVCYNKFYVFGTKTQRNKYTYIAEVRSKAESQDRPPITVHVEIFSGASTGQCIYATLPYIQTQIPIMIVFRALNCLDHMSILSKICYNLPVTEMMSLLKPSLKEAESIKTAESTLAYIGDRGTPHGKIEEERIEYAKKLLRKHFLPHVSVEEN